MKVCNTCKVEKDYSEFGKSSNRKAAPDGYQYKCKLCAKAYYQANKERYYQVNKEYYKNNYEIRFEKSKKYFKDKEDGLHHVYFIPNNGENYVGVTTNIYRRMLHHKHYKRDISEYTILGSFIDREDALRLETEYHDNGYAGRHAFNAYVRK